MQDAADKIVFWVSLGVAAAFLFGCVEAAPAAKQQDAERQAQLATAIKHASILAKILSERTVLTVDGEPAAYCRPIKAKK